MGDFDRKVLERIDVPIGVVDREFRLVFANRAFALWLNPGKGLALEGEDWLTSSLSNTDSVRKSIELAGSTSAALPLRLVLKDRPDMPENARVHRVESDGQVFFMISGTHRRTNQFLKLNRELAYAREAFARENLLLSQQNQALKAIEHFMSVLMHDIRSPLGTVVTAMHFANEDLSEGDSKSASELLIEAKASADRLLRFVNNMYDNQRAYRSEPKLQRVALNDLIRETLDDLSDPVDRASAEICLEEPLPCVQADRSLLRQLFQNLLQNALKFRSSERDLVIRIRWVPDGGGGQLEVEDNGVGFSQATADQLFKLHYKSESKNNDGLGLGLATCKSIADKHGWSLRAQGTVGEGASFFVGIPKVDESP